MMRTYKFKLEPKKGQIEKIEWTLGMCRWLYNSMLEQRKFAYKRRGITLTYHKQAIELPELKKEIPEFKENPFPGSSRRSQAVGQSISSVFPSCATRRKAGIPSLSR
jgi:transposase